MSWYNWGCSQPSIFPQYKIKFDWGNSLLMKSGILGTDTIVNILTIAHSWISIRLYREGFDLVHHYCSWVNYSRSWNFIVVFFFHHNSVYGIKMWLCCSLLKVIILIWEVLPHVHQDVWQILYAFYSACNNKSTFFELKLYTLRKFVCLF